MLRSTTLAKEEMDGRAAQRHSYERSQPVTALILARIQCSRESVQFPITSVCAVSRV